MNPTWYFVLFQKFSLFRCPQRQVPIVPFNHRTRTVITTCNHCIVTVIGQVGKVIPATAIQDWCWCTRPLHLTYQPLLSCGGRPRVIETRHLQCECRKELYDLSLIRLQSGRYTNCCWKYFCGINNTWTLALTHERMIECVNVSIHALKKIHQRSDEFVDREPQKSRAVEFNCHPSCDISLGYMCV